MQNSKQEEKNHYGFYLGEAKTFFQIYTTEREFRQIMEYFKSEKIINEAEDPLCLEMEQMIREVERAPYNRDSLELY